MRLLISHKLFLALLTAIVLVVLVALALTRLNFNRGFLDFLNALEAERIEQVATSLTAIYAESNSWDTLLSNPERWRRVMETYQGRRPPKGNRATPDLAPSGPIGLPERPGPGFNPDDDRGPRRPPRPPNGILGATQPLDLLDVDQKTIIGKPGDVPGSRLWPIVYATSVVGFVRYRPVSEITNLTNAAEQQFIDQQRTALLITAGVALVIAALLALLFGRQLVAPIRNLVAGTEELAAGHLARTIPVNTQDELGQLAAAFNSMAASLAESQETQQQWLADIAHELRTPVAILMGELQSIEDGVREWNPATRASLQMEVERLTGLINDLHEISLSDAGGMSYQRSTIDFSSLVESAVDSFRTRLEQCNLSLETTLPPGVFINGDARRLTQVCTNLLENCCRYTNAGGKVRVHVDATDPVVLTVEDSNPGVPTADLHHVFDRLFRVERSRNRGLGGSGLGLAICKGIVEAHGGHISAAHSPLGGLTIRVELPRYDS